eukprot:1159270-Pelagomonas_calceolata.AAC.2
MVCIKPHACGCTVARFRNWHARAKRHGSQPHPQAEEQELQDMDLGMDGTMHAFDLPNVDDLEVAAAAAAAALDVLAPGGKEGEEEETSSDEEDSSSDEDDSDSSSSSSSESDNEVRCVLSVEGQLSASSAGGCEHIRTEQSVCAAFGQHAGCRQVISCIADIIPPRHGVATQS